ncbi:hypothetical protein ABLB69_05635 [Xenorhabdus khoisanae]|uniref:hypothetical protein n=1 Tax=Xenorhabdus khoisanae TaxID=880157 RepID=UPI002359EE6B|nr:hypothetical protein [Xenorhabdus khoisanae]MDC9615264.1 hypothetical protein [Xenorhabdus khoisanae]
MPKHIHADLIAEYAKLAQTDNKPWLHFQYWDSVADKWLDIRVDFTFCSSAKFRLKQLQPVVMLVPSDTSVSASDI